MDFSELAKIVNEISYEIEFKRNYRFAVETLGMSESRAREFATGATNEQREIDDELLARKNKREWLSRKQGLMKLKLEYAKELGKNDPLAIQIAELSSLLGSIQI